MNLFFYVIQQRRNAQGENVRYSVTFIMGQFRFSKAQYLGVCIRTQHELHIKATPLDFIDLPNHLLWNLLGKDKRHLNSHNSTCMNSTPLPLFRHS